MSRRPRGSAASLLRELTYTIRVLAPCAHGTVARRAIELAQEPPGPGVAATPPKGTRGSGEGSLPSRTRLPRAGRFATLPATGLRPGPSEGESGLPDGAVVPWLLDSCSAILTRQSETKKTNCKPATFCLRTPFSLRAPTATRVSVEYYARAPQAMRTRKAGSNLHPAPGAHVGSLDPYYPRSRRL